MKKLLALIFIIAAVLIGVTAVQAKPLNPAKKVKTAKLRNHHIRRPTVRTFYTTQYVYRYGQRYKNTYKTTIFGNGRVKKRLVRSVRIKTHRHGTRTYYRSHTVFEGRTPYRVTYKIKRFPNGRVRKRLVSKVRIRYR